MKKLLSTTLAVITLLTTSNVSALAQKDTPIDKAFQKIANTVNTFDKQVYIQSKSKNRDKIFATVEKNINRLMATTRAKCPNGSFNTFQADYKDGNCLKALVYQGTLEVLSLYKQAFSLDQAEYIVLGTRYLDLDEAEKCTDADNEADCTSSRVLKPNGKMEPITEDNYNNTASRCSIYLFGGNETYSDDPAPAIFGKQSPIGISANGAGIYQGADKTDLYPELYGKKTFTTVSRTCERYDKSSYSCSQYSEPKTVSKVFLPATSIQNGVSVVNKVKSRKALFEQFNLTSIGNPVSMGPSKGFQFGGFLEVAKSKDSFGMYLLVCGTIGG